MDRLKIMVCTAACLVIGWAGPSSGRAEVILGPAPSGTIDSYYDRFIGGYPSDPNTTVNNSTFYQSSLDLSGVGWKLPNLTSGAGTAWNVAMIDNVHFIAAWHVHVAQDGTGKSFLGVGDTVNFRPSNSTTAIIQRQIASVVQVPNPDNSTTDVMLGTLSAPFTALDHIMSYPIPTNTDFNSYSQMPIFAYGRESRFGRNNFSPTVFNGSPSLDFGTGPTQYFSTDYDQPQFGASGNPDGLPSTVGPDESHLEGGDSGGPSFIMVGNQLQLIGDHIAIASYSDVGLTAPPGGDTTAFSFDSFLPFYASEIATLTAPEPGSLGLGLFAAGGAALGIWRRRRNAVDGVAPNDK